MAERRLRLMLYRAMEEYERRAYQAAEDRNFAEDVESMARDEARNH